MSVRNFVFLVLAFLLMACSGPNVMPIQVGNCGPGTYPNEPCVSVTVCSPGSSACQTIPNILLDTGSYGLRLFASTVPVSLQSQTSSNGGVVAECSAFADGSSEWGPVKIADVVLGSERAAGVPIQIVDSNFSQLPSSCTNPDTSPQQAGYNGILGVGPVINDCGQDCADSATNNMYFACSSAGCQGVAVPVKQQVSNPVAYLATDNNGISITLPAVPVNGATSVSGVMVLGIGTASNNQATPTAILPTDASGNFITQFGGSTYTTSFIDSGSNAYFFPATSNTPACPSGTTSAGLDCPSSVVSLNAVQTGINRGQADSVLFQILPASLALAGPNLVFSDLGGTGTGAFDWGLPFFYNRTVWVVFSGRSSPIAAGPAMAYR